MSETAQVVGSAEGDLPQRALGIVRLAIPIPFPQAGGPVNAYLVDNEDGSLTLFDSGLGTDEAERTLLAGFAEAGRRPEEVTRILLSHGHIDHYGAARFMVERSGATVFVHPADREKVVAQGRWIHRKELYRAYFLALGVPDEGIEGMASTAGASKMFARPVASAEPLADGQAFRFRHFEGRILHMPGHTPGLVCMHVPEHRLIFTDDHLLARVSPNPLLELGPEGEEDKFRALPAYFASARRLKALDVEWVLPGHGPPFKDHRARIDSLVQFYERRGKRILKALEAAPKTPYELVLDVFGKADTLQLFLMLSEIVGNLELLEDQGLVQRRQGPGPHRYTATRRATR